MTQPSSQQVHRRILLINGPNLNLLGLREPEIYGHTTLQDIEQRLSKTAKKHNIELISIQSNHEGELVDAVQHHGLLADSEDKIDAVIIILQPSPTLQWRYEMLYWPLISLL